MPELKWTRDRTYYDGQRGFRAEGPGVYDVPEEAVEEYLDHRSGGWERVDEEDADTDAGDDERVLSNATATVDVDASEPIDGSDEEPIGEGGSEPTDDEGEVTPDDLASSDDWRWVVDTIESGTVDDQLDAVEAAEEERENGPRDSVLSALDARRGA